MQPLKKVVGDARIVAVGEATHGTREFFQMKHRMFEFLVEEMGFTIFAIEGNQPEARVINDYVLNGKGDPRRALGGLYFWTWDTEEVLALIEWMRTYNANPAHTRKVQFYGFDMQFGNVAAANVIAYVRGIAPDAVSGIEADLTAFKDLDTESALHEASTEAKTRALEGATRVLEKLDAMQADTDAWRNARQDALILQQAARTIAAIPIAQTRFRDEAMADNVDWILDQNPGAKIMLWAHNGHVSTASTAGYMPMGAHLKQHFGREMVVFGFAYNQGSFQAIDMEKGLREFKVRPAPPGSLDAAMAAAGIPAFALDMRAAAGSVRDWLRTPQPSRDTGAIFADAQEMILPPRETAQAFDVLLFVEKTTRAHPLPALKAGAR